MTAYNGQPSFRLTLTMLCMACSTMGIPVTDNMKGSRLPLVGMQPNPGLVQQGTSFTATPDLAPFQPVYEADDSRSLQPPGMSTHLPHSPSFSNLDEWDTWPEFDPAVREILLSGGEATQHAPGAPPVDQWSVLQTSPEPNDRHRPLFPYEMDIWSTLDPAIQKILAPDGEASQPDLLSTRSDDQSDGSRKHNPSIGPSKRPSNQDAIHDPNSTPSHSPDQFPSALGSSDTQTIPPLPLIRPLPPQFLLGNSLRQFIIDQILRFTADGANAELRKDLESFWDRLITLNKSCMSTAAARASSSHSPSQSSATAQPKKKASRSSAEDSIRYLYSNFDRDLPSKRHLAQRPHLALFTALPGDDLIILAGRSLRESSEEIGFFFPYEFHTDGSLVLNCDVLTRHMARLDSTVLFRTFTMDQRQLRKNIRSVVSQKRLLNILYAFEFSFEEIRELLTSADSH